MEEGWARGVPFADAALHLVWKRGLAHAPLRAGSRCSHVPLAAGDEDAVGLGAGAHQHLVPLHQRQPAARTATRAVRAGGR